MSNHLGRLLFGTHRGKLILSVATIHALMMTLFLLDLTHRHKQLLLERQMEQVVALVNSLASVSTTEMAANDISGLQELVEAQRNYPGLKYAMFQDGKGRILAHTESAHVGQYALDLPSSTGQVAILQKGALLEGFAPVVTSRQHLGWVRIGVDQLPAQGKLASITRDGITYTLVAVLLGSLLAWFLANRFTRRLFELRSVMHAVREGRPNLRSQVTGIDEIADLSSGFNSMLERLESREVELHLANQALSESGAQNRALLNAIPDLIFMNRRNGEYLAVHASDPQNLYVPPEAALNKRALDVLPRQVAEQFMAAFAKALDTGEVQELTYALPINGEEKHFEGRVAPSGDDKVITIVRDVTKRQRAEEERAKLEAQLHQAHKMESLGSLAGGIAHDMNNILGAIMGLASANLESQPEGSAAHRAFGTILKATERGGRMVQGLLNFARQNPAEVRKLDLNALLREEVHLLERTTLSKIHLQLDLDENLRSVMGDANALTHAFMNLCVNAVDAMPGEGTLTLRTRNIGPSWIEAQVEDSGTGIPRAILGKVFDPFFTTKEVGKGTGLGLTIVYSTINAHRGQVEIQSDLGSGTCVTVRLPACCEAEPPTPSAVPEPPAQAEGGPIRVLVVDDDALIQSSMQAILGALGHTAILASGGEEALAKLEGGLQVDLVVLDMNMPGMSGGEALPRIRELRRSVPILLATGRPDQVVQKLLQAHTNVTLMSKPFDMNTLKKHLADVSPH
jgi:signal transduction histidine kinase/HAMP domain-containing protein